MLDQSDEGQQSLFTKAEWEDMKLQMMQRYVVHYYKRRVPAERIATSWNIITGVLENQSNCSSSPIVLQ
ncbi:hypothetical protein MBANPS3_011360 [Mucor bainieri]